MKLITTLLFSLMMIPLLAVHHEGEGHSMKDKNNFAYLSTYVIPDNTNPKKLEKSLLGNVETLEANGYNLCGLLRHQFGAERGFYTYCYFDDFEQFAEINDNQDPQGDVKQLHADHSDHLVAVVKKGLKKRTQYILMATYTFGPYLTDNQRRKNANILYDAYNEAFEGCNLMEHFWGPELAWYVVCGYENYADFNNKANVLAGIHEERLADLKLDVMTHKDDLLIRVSN